MFAKFMTIGTAILLAVGTAQADDDVTDARTARAVGFFQEFCLSPDFRFDPAAEHAGDQLWPRLPLAQIDRRRPVFANVEFDGWVGTAPEMDDVRFSVYAGFGRNQDEKSLHSCAVFFEDVSADAFIELISQDFVGIAVEETSGADGTRQVTFSRVAPFVQNTSVLEFENAVDGHGVFAGVVLILDDGH